MHRDAIPNEGVLAPRRAEHTFAWLMVGLGALCCYFGSLEIGGAVAAFSALAVLIDPA